MADKKTDADTADSTPDPDEFSVEDGAKALLDFMPDDDDVTPASKKKGSKTAEDDDDDADDDVDDDDVDDDDDDDVDEDSDDKGTDDEDSDSEDDEDDEDDDDGPELRTIVIDGKPELVSFDEALKGYSRTSDYTRKTQALAAERTATAGEVAKTREVRKQYAEHLEKLDEELTSVTPAEPDWEKIRRENPEQFASVHAEWTLYQDRRGKLTAERERVAKEHQDDLMAEDQKYLVGQQKLLKLALPDLTDPEKRGDLKARLMAHAATLGYTEDEVKAAGDHRALLLLNDSMQLAAIKAKAKKAKTTAKKKKVPTLKPGGRKTSRTKGKAAAKAARARLRETGSVDDAAAALEGLNLE